MIAADVVQSLIDATIADIGRAATAANAQFLDMAGVGTSMLNNLKLPADQKRDSIGALVIAGKEGSFELKDMAQHFPRLTSQVAKFGVNGREAVDFLGSALQIAMKGTSDPSIAAKNLSNFLSKALSERTIKTFLALMWIFRPSCWTPLPRVSIRWKPCCRRLESASLCPDAKESAKQHGLDNNQSALLTAILLPIWGAILVVVSHVFRTTTGPGLVSWA
ncbi:phage tail tape measure protein [Brucella sp. 21LCYQ03]|nr:phage tail tape measure protein [Brucella sp. 21LCYQ03]